MATARDVSKQQTGWLPSSPVSLSAGTGWGAAPASAEADEAKGDTVPAHQEEPQPRYLTTSGLFERPPRPSAWEEADLGPVPAPAPQPSVLVDEFRSAIQPPQNKEREDVQPRKSRKGIWALVVVGILLAATLAGLWLYHPGKSATKFQTVKAWVGKQWTADLQGLSSVFHSQAAAREITEPNRRRGLRPWTRGRKSAKLRKPVTVASLREIPSTEDVPPFDVYVTDFYGRRWILTQEGQVFGPADHFGDLSALKPDERPKAPEHCQSPFYHRECP